MKYTNTCKHKFGPWIKSVQRLESFMPKYEGKYRIESRYCLYCGKHEGRGVDKKTGAIV